MQESNPSESARPINFIAFVVCFNGLLMRELNPRYEVKRFKSQGTWMIEGNNRDSERQAIEALQLGLDLGLIHIDTAEMYGNGQVEEKIVAEAIAGRREQVFLVSKVWPSNAS